MIAHRINMSETLMPLLALEPLQLAFMQAGRLKKHCDGDTHRKAIPYTIVAQACEGTYEVWCDGKHEVVSSGGIFLVPAHAPVKITHWAGRRGIMAARWLHLRFSLWGMIDFLSLYELPLQLPKPASLRLGKIIGRVLRSQAAEEADTDAMILRSELAMDALRLICNASKAKKHHSLIHWQRLHPVLRHIQEHLSEEISVEKLAAVTNLSPAQFHVLFKAEFGITPMRHVRNMRLDFASRQLVTKNWTLSQIAESAGFKDPFHFSHAFKTQFGISPRKYREQASAELL